MQYFVYIIGENTEEESPYPTSYVGVTNDPKNRWYGHSRSDHKIGKTLREYKFTYENNMKIIFMGDSSQCYEMENILRPTTNIGLNVAVGGHGGYTSYSKERNLKISKSLMGRTNTWGHKSGLTRKLSGLSVGANNGMAKKWLLTTPEGTTIEVHGNIQDTCKQLNILWRCLMKNKSNVVPDIITGKMGGFRAKSPEHLIMRKNTVGWKIEQLGE